MNYSREAFRAWLTTLPPDERFCEDKQCPIDAYLGCGWFKAMQLDSDLTRLIDANVKGWDWQSATPPQIIALIDKLSPRKEKAKGIPSEILSLFDGRAVRNPDREIA